MKTVTRKPRAPKAPVYLPAPGDRIYVAPKGWSQAKAKWRYEAYVNAYDAETDQVTVWRNTHAYSWSRFGSSPEIVAGKLVRQMDRQAFADPEPPRKFRFSIEYQPEVCADVPARFVLIASYGELNNTYYCADEREVFEWIDTLLDKPVCGVCGCQLAQVAKHVVCQRSLDHKQPAEVLVGVRDRWDRGLSRYVRDYMLPEIEQSPVGGCRHNGARFNTWLKRNQAAMTRVETKEPYESHGFTVQRPIIKAGWVDFLAHDDWKRVAKWRQERATYMPRGDYRELSRAS